MKRRVFRKSFAPLLLLLLFLVDAAGQYEASWYEEPAEAQAEAKASGRPILIAFTGSDWSSHCMAMDLEVLSTPEFKAYAADHLVLLRIDFPRELALPGEVAEQNEALRERYRVVDLPTFLLTSSEGAPLARVRGYQPGGPSLFIEHLEALLETHLPGYEPET